MLRINDISLSLDYTDKTLIKAVAKKLSVNAEEIISLKLLKKAVDARKKTDVHFVVSVAAEIKCEGEILDRQVGGVFPYEEFTYTVSRCKPLENSPVIVGAGPAGLFAAYVLSKAGLNPILLERGKDIDSRKADVDGFKNGGRLNLNSNVQFGEGGAGAFSDGKLTTGIKDKRIRFVLETFVKFGAHSDILTDAKPHIGTDRLIPTVRNMRNEIIALGGRVIFGARFCDFTEKNGCLTSIIYEKDGEKAEIITDNCILAVGHSARDVYELLKAKDFELQQKNFAMGVRIEHLQKDIDYSMYGDFAGHPNLKPADYKLAVHLNNGRSLYTFCMCPGGYVLPCASEEGGVVTNGMSYFARDGINSNSALLVGISPEDFGSDDPLAGMYMQRNLEQSAFKEGGENYNAPITRVGDFLKGRVSKSFGKIKPTYEPGVTFSDFNSWMPRIFKETLKEGIPLMGRKIRGFDCEDALLTAVESRSSAPVRVLRDTEGYESCSLRGIYPCGEGAGYAGGIVSAAVDGIKIAESIIEKQLTV